MDWLFGKSEMAKLILNMDWSASPLGPIEQWPEALKNTASLCLNSNFPISIVWGTEYNQLYNDGYLPLCGDKHPHSMGQNFKECWAATWPAVKDSFEQAFTGKAAYLINERLFVDRFGYMEETFFTFSFSPILGKSGVVEGLFIPVIETTEKMLSERRGHILREISATTSKAKTIKDVAQLTIHCLSEHHVDLPFALIYFFDDSRESATLIASTGLEATKTLCIKKVFLNQPQDQTWPLYESHDKKMLVLTDLEHRFWPFTCEPYPESVKNAVIFPIYLAGKHRRHGALIFGVSPRRALDEAYKTFYELLGASVTNAINTAYSYEQEKRRAEALADIDRAKTAFFNNISHEFRTPLTLMIGPLESILFEGETKLPQKIRTDVDVAYRNCIRLLKLVNNLLDFSRLESQQMEAFFEPVFLHEITADIASSFLPAMEKAGLQFIVNCNTIKKPVYIDKGMWEKIVLNLLSNAFKYTLKGSVTLTLKAVNDHVELTIRDTGVGIPTNEVKKIFDRFHRVKGIEGRTHEGTGIGLALVNELVNLHHGTIRVKSKIKSGSAFMVSIPLGSTHLPAHQIREHIVQRSASDHKYTKAFIEEALGLLFDDTSCSTETIQIAKVKGSERIVLAEDNADMRQYISHLLSEYYHVLSFANGKDALKAIVADPPDIIVSDVMMPVMDGLELIQHVRANKTVAKIPIILLSARAGQEAMISGIGSGADDYLVKPFSAKELLVRIKQQFAMLHLRQESNKLKDEFLANVSHDLRTPLTTILGFVSLIINKTAGNITSQQKDFLNHVTNAANHLLNLINDILDTTKIEAGKISFHPVRINLNTVVSEVVNTLTPATTDKEIKLTIKIAPRISMITQDPVRLKQVLYNFLSNAIKFSPRHGVVFLHVSPHENDMFRIDVNDNGIGINPEDLHQLFSKFTQLHTKRKPSGTGLGLFITKHLVEAQGGTVSVKSELGKGSTFSALLPRTMASNCNKKDGERIA